MKAAIYARYSTDLQRQASIEDQYRTCLVRIEREGWTVSGKYKDEAVSGAKADRHGYQALLEAAKNREFDVIVVEEVSRLWRDQEEQHRSVKRLEYWGVHLMGCNDGIDTRAGYGLLLGIRGALNEETRREIGKRTHRGLTGVAMNGHSAGGRSYGYRHVAEYHRTKKDHLNRPMVVAVHREIDAEQAKWVRWIYEHYADGWTAFQIAHELNAKGVLAPGMTWNRKVRKECKGWARSAIYGNKKLGFGILLNPLYRGLIIWNRTRRVVDPDTKSRKHMPRPESEWVVTEAPELRIISEELWQRVQIRLTETRQNGKSGAIRAALARTGRAPKYLFSTLMTCAVCGGNYTIVGGQNYGCANHKDRGNNVCANGARVPRRELEARLLEGIKKDLFTPESLEQFKRTSARLLAEARKERRPDLKATKARLASVDKEIDNMVAAIKRGAYCEALQGELDRVQTERERLLQALDVDLRGLDRIGEFLPRAAERYQELVENLGDVTLRDVSRARAQIRQLVGKIRLIPEDGALYAEMQGNYAGLLKLANAIMVVPRRGLEPPRGCPH